MALSNCTESCLPLNPRMSVKEANQVLKYSNFSISAPEACRSKSVYHYFSFNRVFLMTNFDCKLFPE